MPASESLAFGPYSFLSYVKQRLDYLLPGRAVSIRNKETTHDLTVCAWLIAMNGPEDGVQVMTIPSCSHPGSCCKVESGISSRFIVLIFFPTLFFKVPEWN